MTMTDNEKLIEEARDVVRSWDLKGSWNADSPIGMLARMADALEAAEKAHTPTDDEVSSLTKQYADRIFAAGLRAPESTTAVIVFKEIAAGFRRSEVPEPSAERERFTDHSERYVPKRPKQGEPSDTLEAVRRLKAAGVGAYMILAAVTNVYDMETKS